MRLAAGRNLFQSENISGNVFHDDSQMSAASEQGHSVLIVTQATDVPDQVVCGACERQVRLASHLRDSSQCLDHLRTEAQFERFARAKRETFIAKATLVLGGCPALECPGGGNHVGSPLPDQCFEWYRIQGGRVMAWKGALPDKKTVKNKISMFLRNVRSRRSQSGDITGSESQNQSQISITSGQSNLRTNATEVPDQLVCVNGCFYGENLAAHLLQQPNCLADFILQHLMTRTDIYEGQSDLAVFDLSNILSFCPNPACDTELPRETRDDQRARARHVRGNCLGFYQIEGANLLGWSPNLDPDTILKKLENRREYLRKHVSNTEEKRVQAFEEEWDRMRLGTCATCNIQGPLSGQEMHKLVVTGGTVDSPEFKCLSCYNQVDKHMEMVQNFHEKLHLLSFEKPGDIDTAMVAVRSCNGKPVLLPAALRGEMEIYDGALPHNVTVLLPNMPGALDQLPEELFDEANRVSEALTEVTDFASRRVIADTTPVQMASLFWRNVQAQIKKKRMRMLEAMKKTIKGEIETRVPRTVFTRSQIPTYPMTKWLSLVDTCLWSEGSKKKSHRESRGRAAVNGVVRTNVKMTLADLKPDKRPSLALAPSFLNVAYGKMRALEKHIIKPAYSNYDLEVRFHHGEWKIDLVGSLFSNECRQINADIAADVIDLGERAAKVCKLSTVLPTVSLESHSVAETYSISQERAAVIVQLARCLQVADRSEPLSLMDITTIWDHQPTQGELVLRVRAAEIGQRYDEQEDTYSAILQICQALMNEGFQAIAADYGSLDLIKRGLAEALGREDIDHTVIIYHCLLVRTTSRGKWTLRRACGESRIRPYIPRILAANKNTMEAEVCYLGEEILRQGELQPVQSLSGLPTHFGLNWTERSFLEFINAAMPSRGPKLTNATSQSMTPILAERNEKITWRNAPEMEEDDDQYDIFVNQRGQRCIRANSDIRVLYEGRPEGVDMMCLAQFAAQYRPLIEGQQSKKVYDRIVAEVDPDTGLGLDSMDDIAGSDPRIAAPKAMKLKSSSKIMVKRIRGDAVPDLRFSGAVNRYSNILLFTPWRELESIRVHQEEPVETDTQRRRRLALFPLSKFETCKDDYEEEEAEL